MGEVLVVAEPVCDLASTDGGLRRRLLGDRSPGAISIRDCDELVDQPGSGSTTAGDDLRTDEVAVGRVGTQVVDHVLVEVSGDKDLGAGSTELVEELAGVGDLDGEVTRVDPD